MLPHSILIKSCFYKFFSTASDTMKLSQGAVFVFLLLVFTILEENEAAKGQVGPNWFQTIATALGKALVKNSHYCRCNTRNVPAGMNCPGVVYGVGLNRNQCQKAAQAYANRVGQQGCAKYIGHCQIYQFKGK